MSQCGCVRFFVHDPNELVHDPSVPSKWSKTPYAGLYALIACAECHSSGDPEKPADEVAVQKAMKEAEPHSLCGCTVFFLKQPTESVVWKRATIGDRIYAEAVCNACSGTGVFAHPSTTPQTYHVPFDAGDEEEEQEDFIDDDDDDDDDDEEEEDWFGDDEESKPRGAMENIASKAKEIVGVMGEEGGQALLRAGTAELVDQVRAPLVAKLMKEMGLSPKSLYAKAIGSFLDTNFGEGVFTYGLGVVTPFVGKMLPAVAQEYSVTLGTEMRVAGQAAMLRPVIRAIGDPIKNFILSKVEGPRLRVGLPGSSPRDERYEEAVAKPRARAAVCR